MKQSPTLITILTGGLLGGVVQVAVVYLVAARMRPAQIIASFVFSTVLGGVVTALLLVKMELDPYLAGSAGTASGMLPAITLPFIFLRYGLKRSGMTEKDVLDKVDEIILPLQGGVNTSEGKPE